MLPSENIYPQDLPENIGINTEFVYSWEKNIKRNTPHYCKTEFINELHIIEDLDNGIFSVFPVKITVYRREGSFLQVGDERR